MSNNISSVKTSRSCAEIYAGFVLQHLDKDIQACCKIPSENFKNLDIDLILPNEKVVIDFRGRLHYFNDNHAERDNEKQKVLISDGYKFIVVEEVKTLKEVKEPHYEDGIFVINNYSWSLSHDHAFKYNYAVVNMLLQYITDTQVKVPMDVANHYKNMAYDIKESKR